MGKIIWAIAMLELYGIRDLSNPVIGMKLV